MRRAYQELRKAVPALPCRVEDTHNPRLRGQWTPDAYDKRGILIERAHWALVPIEPESDPAPRRRRVGRAR